MRLLAQTVELFPTQHQKYLFVQHAHMQRISRNDILLACRDVWVEGLRHEDGKPVTFADVRRLYSKQKYELRPWYRDKGMCQQPSHRGVQDFEDSVKRFRELPEKTKKQMREAWDLKLARRDEKAKAAFYRKRRKQCLYPKAPGSPRVKPKGSPKRFRLDSGSQETIKIHLPEDTKYPFLKVQKTFGDIKMSEPLRFEDVKTGKLVIYESGGGRWFMSLTMHAPDEYRRCPDDGAIGIDLGLKTMVTIAYGDGVYEKISAPLPLKKMSDRRKRLSRGMSRKKFKSTNWERAKSEVQKIDHRIGEVRKAFLHELSNRLTMVAKTICIETVNIAGFQRMPRWGKKVCDIGLGELIRQLKYKGGWRGNNIVELPQNFPSSKLCSKCGWKFADLQLSIRKWICGGCGAEHDRDENAADNIRNEGMKVTT